MKNTTFRHSLRVLALSITLVISPIPQANAQISTLCVNCGDQITQFLNYGQLLLQTATSASQLATQVSQYMTMIQNLQQLPKEMLNGISLPFNGQLGDLSKLYNAANSLSYSATQANNMIDGVTRGSLASGLNPTSYLQSLAQQAQTRGGVYQTMVDDNNRRLKDLQQTSTSFQQAAQNVPNLQGNLDSLAQLNSLAAASGNVATEMLAVQRQSVGMQLEEKSSSEAAKTAISVMKQQQIQEEDAMHQGISQGLKTSKPWK